MESGGWWEGRQLRLPDGRGFHEKAGLVKRKLQDRSCPSRINSKGVGIGVGPVKTERSEPEGSLDG